VTPIVPSRETLYPASPSLQWVAWASLPHLTVQLYVPGHRYYDPLRLPDACLGFVRFSLSSPDTLLAPLLSLAVQVRAPLPSAWISPRWLTGTHLPDCCSSRKTSGSPEFPSYPHECMPWSQTPVVSLMLAITYAGLLPSAQLTPSAFSHTSGIIPVTTTIHFSGLNTQPASLIHPASDSPLGVGPRTSLLIWWLTFNQVGLESRSILTHWVAISNFIPPSGNPNDLSLSRHDN
jgi:hypothetical protein